MIDLTIVIASYETWPHLMACLESLALARSAHPEIECETIVIDNGSRDGSANAVIEKFPDVRLYALARNRGFAAAINLGIAARRGRAVLLLNSDVEIDADLLSNGLRILDRHAEVGVVGAALRHSDGRPQRSVHPLPGLQTELLPHFVLKRLRPAGFACAASDRRDDHEPGLQKVEAVRGAVFLIRGDLIDEIGPLNEGFFFFLEETEFCARTRRAGYEVVYAEGLRAIHHLGASSKRRASLATRIEFHRSLYRYLGVERGAWTVQAARIVRALRGGVLVAAMLAVYPFSTRIRSRLPERWGLFLWHLQGCPLDPPLAEILEEQANPGA